MTFSTFAPATASNITLSNGNLTAVATTASAMVRSNDAQNAGKYYFEMTFTRGGSSTTSAFGIANFSYILSTTSASTDAMVYEPQGGVYSNAASKATLPTIAQGVATLLCFAVDLDDARMWVRVGASGSWNAASGTANNPTVASTGIDLSGIFASPTTPVSPIFHATNINDQITGNFGDSAFTGTVPTGFTAGWPMQTIPTPLIVTQAGAEAWGANPGPPVRVTQAGAEAWGVNAAAPIVVTQAGAEAWGANPGPPVRVTQAGAEAWGANTAAPLQVTQAGTEVWFDRASPILIKAPSICIMT